MVCKLLFRRSLYDAVEKMVNTDVSWALKRVPRSLLNFEVGKPATNAILN